MTSMTHSVEIITADAANKIVGLAIEKARQQNIRISVAVVAPGTNLITLLSDDGATPHSVFTCQKKAVTSASTRRPSGWMEGALAVDLPQASGGMLCNVSGGAPIKFNGQLVGAIGIAGGTVAQDASILAETLAALGADPV